MLPCGDVRGEEGPQFTPQISRFRDGAKVGPPGFLFFFPHHALVISSCSLSARLIATRPPTVDRRLRLKSGAAVGRGGGQMGLTNWQIHLFK